MYFNFQTDDHSAATAALIVYAIYRSRNKKRFKITTDMWGIIERAIKSKAKRAEDLYDFMEKLKPRLACESIHPRWAKTLPDEEIMKSLTYGPNGEIIEIEEKGKRQFMTELLGEADHKEVLNWLEKKANYIVLLVRDRLEREKPIETKFNIIEGEGEDGEEV